MEHITSDTPAPCWHCGNPTNQVEISFQAHLCPGPCTQSKWDEFDAACRALPGDPDDPFETPEQRNHRMYREYVALTRQAPPRAQHPQNTLSEKVLTALADRPDLIDWALGRN